MSILNIRCMFRFYNRIVGAMWSPLAVHAVDHWFECPGNVKSKDYINDFGCHFSKHTTLSHQSYDNACICAMLFKWATSIQIQLRLFVLYDASIIITPEETHTRHNKLVTWYLITINHLLYFPKTYTNTWNREHTNITDKPD